MEIVVRCQGAVIPLDVFHQATGTHLHPIRASRKHPSRVEEDDMRGPYLAEWKPATSQFGEARIRRYQKTSCDSILEASVDLLKGPPTFLKWGRC